MVSLDLLKRLDRLSGKSLHKMKKKKPRQFEKAACTLQMLVYIACFSFLWISIALPCTIGTYQVLDWHIILYSPIKGNYISYI